MYSLAVVLYELLTGKPPFTASNMEALLQKILQQAPVAPSQHRPDLSTDLDRILLRALAKRPEQRYSTWAEFALALAEVGERGLPPGTVPDSEKYVVLKKVEMLSGLNDAELWELVRTATWTRVPANSVVMRENDRGKVLYLLGKGQAKATRQGRVLNRISEGECFGEMAFIRAGRLPRRATVESMTELLVAEFEPEAVGKMSLGAQLYLTRAMVRNLVDRLELANTAAR
jgi:CRP-like cAMP-binding protein